MAKTLAWLHDRAIRFCLLPAAALMLLAAGEAGTPSLPTGETVTPVSDDILAPMSAADAAAAAEALAASTPIDPSLPDAPAGPSLAAMVDALDADVSDNSELACLATAVYYESRGEPLEGQLAVAQAIVNRTQSGRYAATLCGVIRQPGQFSFASARSPRDGRDWRIARAIARIAAGDLWREVAPDAMSFHAVHVSPGWRGLTRVARIGNHIFYR